MTKEEQYDTLKPGERVGWRTINGYASGIVESNDDKGVLVRTDRGLVILSSRRSILAARAERKARIDDNAKRTPNHAKK